MADLLHIQTKIEILSEKEYVKLQRYYLEMIPKMKTSVCFFRLDWFMDPYYQQDISDIHDDLVLLLQTVITEPNEDDVIEDAIEIY